MKKLFASFVCCLALISIIGCGGIMTDKTSTDNHHNDESLPYEPDSGSELLSATHIISVEIISLKETPWSSEDGMLEQRVLDVDLKLLKVLKGAVDLEPGNGFTIRVTQRRESEFEVSDYHGLWSHIELQKGQSYLIISTAASNSPPTLMQEDTCKGIHDTGYEGDVRLALDAERLYNEKIHETDHGDRPELAAAEAIIGLTESTEIPCKDMYARYLWARIRPSFLQYDDSLKDKVLSMIIAEEKTYEFRSSLIADFDDAVLFLDSKPSLANSALKAYLEIILQNKSERLHDALVNVYIYNSIFDDKGHVLVKAIDIFPDVSYRQRLKVAVGAIDSKRATEIVKWLGNVP